MIVVDFEKYYDSEVSLTELGMENYCRDDGDTYLVSIYGEGISFVGRPEVFDWTQLNEKDLASHNASFDPILAVALVDKNIIPPFYPRSWSCTADLVSAMGYPRSLDKATKAVFNIDVDKTVRSDMKKKTWEDVVAAGDEEKVKEYCLLDSVYSHKLWEALQGDWSPFEREVSALNRKIGMRGVKVDKEYLEEGLVLLNEALEEIHGKLPWYPEAKPGSPLAAGRHLDAEKMDKPINEEGKLCFDKTNKCYLEWEAKYKDSHEFVLARRAMQPLNTQIKKLKRIKKRIRSNGRMESLYKYAGAHTLRFSGGGGVNLQALTKDERHGFKERNIFVPEDGHKFIVADAAQIEPRVTAWETGDVEMLEALHAGVPLYEQHARTTMGWTGGNLKKEDPGRYALAKVRVLALNYQCGWETFRDQAAISYGVKMSDEEARYQHGQYRQSNPLIVGYWKAREADLQRAFEDQKDLERKLPSGRTMIWRKPESSPYDRRDIVVTTQGRRDKTYGGRLTENIIQAIARDVLCTHMLEIEKKWPIVMHIHDEVVCEVPEDQADEALEDILKTMSTPPDWSENLVLSAEGGVFDRYDK